MIQCVFYDDERANFTIYVREKLSLIREIDELIFLESHQKDQKAFSKIYSCLTNE
jgi:hypothetical protein